MNLGTAIRLADHMHREMDKRGERADGVLWLINLLRNWRSMPGALLWRESYYWKFYIDRRRDENWQETDVFGYDPADITSQHVAASQIHYRQLLARRLR